MVRTPSVGKDGMKKGAWSPEEDNKLRAYVQRYGHWNWRELPKFAGLSRCGRSCRFRWMQYLRPNVKRGKFMKEEEDLLLNLHEQLGNKWSAIAAKLPGRTDNEVKNYWNTHLIKRRHMRENEAIVDVPEDLSKQMGSELTPNDFTNSSPPQIVESNSPPSPALPSGELSSLTCDSFPLDGISSSGTLQESIGNFWTELFSEDLWDRQNEFSFNLVEGRLMSPDPAFFFSPDNLFCQIREDFPDN